MMLISGSFAGMQTMELLWKTLYCVAGEAVAVAVTCIGINTTVTIRFDSKGNERRKKKARR